MSRGPGKMQALIMKSLRESSVSLSTADLQESCLLEIWAAFKATPERRRSIRMSMGRALRQLEAGGQIKRDKAGNWYPSKDWAARDSAERMRARMAYHEAGHAVIGLALKLPIAFVTIKPKGAGGAHVSLTPIHYSLGEVYARGSYSSNPIDASKQDAFGNPVSEAACDWHADIVMSVAGGMAEAEFNKENEDWRKLWSSGDRSAIAFARRQLGAKARSIQEYEVKCEKLIKQHWILIEAVAARLLKEETLSGSHVYSICWRVARNVVRRQHLKTMK